MDKLKQHGIFGTHNRTDMKRNLLLLLSLTVLNSLACLAQQPHKGESILLYYMPKTILTFQLNIEKKIEKPGKFYLYAEKYLGTTDVITEETESYALKDVSIKTKCEPDISRAYAIHVTEKINASYIINKKGLLSGINIEATEPATKTTSQTKPTENTTTKTTELSPYNEEQMRANSMGKMAEEVAQQIYRIRESRLNLLMGDIDQLPNDGVSLKTMLKKLNEEEQKLCARFVGTTTITSYQQTIEYTPSESLDNHILFRFSPHQGVVDANDLSGEPIYLNLIPSIKTYAPETKKDKKNQIKTAIYYNLPGSALITLSDGQNNLCKKKITIPQFGISIPLPMSLFEKKQYKAKFDTKTGTLIELTK